MAEEGKDGAWETAPEPEDPEGGYRGGGGECVGEEQFILQGERAGGGGYGSGWCVGGCEAEDECVVARGVRGMSTPQTDDIARGNHVVPVEWAEKLERERDEAFELLASEKTTRNHIIKRSVEVERERDEAREHLDNMQDQRDFAMKVIKRLEQERDEARFLLKQAQSSLDAIHLEVGGWIKILKENTD